MVSSSGHQHYTRSVFILIIISRVARVRGWVFYWRDFFVQNIMSGRLDFTLRSVVDGFFFSRFLKTNGVVSLRMLLPSIYPS